MFKAAAVLGFPARHSRSPLVHGHWLRQFGLRGAYLRLETPPDKFAATLKSLADLGLTGANVTIPHKEAAFRLADDVDPDAVRLAAINTLWLEDGRLRGTNTDVYGFLANLDEGAPGWDHERHEAVVLGAGGAARAVVQSLLQRGFGRVSVCNRTISRAEELSALFGPKLRPLAWQDTEKALTGASLLVNTTSLGMHGSPPLDLDLASLPASAVVTDIVYVPRETDLLRRAAALNLRTVDGLGMLLHQAVPGFEKWFGLRPAVTPALRQLIIDDIEGRT